MAKSITPMSIDEDIKKQAKERLINMSAVAEKALRDKLGKKTVEIDDTIKQCFFCAKECEKAYIDRSGKYHNGMIWLYPDEKWICSNCFKKKSSDITKFN